MILDLINIISDFLKKITALILHNFKLRRFLGINYGKIGALKLDKRIVK